MAVETLSINKYTKLFVTSFVLSKIYNSRRVVRKVIKRNKVPIQEIVYVLSQVQAKKQEIQRLWYIEKPLLGSSFYDGFFGTL